jgi:hypothetical protein
MSAIPDTGKEPRKYTVTPAVIEQRREARLTHGAQSRAALSPLVVSMKKSLLARMGIRQRDLTWAGRELLDVYCAARSKITAIDTWLETNALIDASGNVAPVMRVYLAALNTSVRTLEALRGVVAEQAREDGRFDKALTALAAEGRKVREANADE